MTMMMTVTTMMMVIIMLEGEGMDGEQGPLSLLLGDIQLHAFTFLLPSRIQMQRARAAMQVAAMEQPQFATTNQ